MSTKKQLITYILLPGIMPLLFSCIAATPVAVLGCRTRGLLAFAIALLSGCAAIPIKILSLRAIFNLL